MLKSTKNGILSSLLLFIAVFPAAIWSNTADGWKTWKTRWAGLRSISLFVPGPPMLEFLAHRPDHGGCTCRRLSACLTLPNPCVRARSMESRSLRAACSVQLRSHPQQHDPQQQVYETHTEDAIYCNTHKISFLRAAFGTCDDLIDVPIIKAEPFEADSTLVNEKELRGKIVLVQRGSRSGAPCSFVSKAIRVETAGALGMVVVNTEDCMLSPGDSAREGTAVNIPVVGIRSGDLAHLTYSPAPPKVSLTFKPITLLTAEQRWHLRAVASGWDRQGSLQEVVLDGSAASQSQSLLSTLDELLGAHEMVRLRIKSDDEGTQTISLQTLEDIVDVATVLTDNLGATLVHIAGKTILMYRHSSSCKEPITLPMEGQVSDLDIDFDELAGAISILDFELEDDEP